MSLISFYLIIGFAPLTVFLVLGLGVLLVSGKECWKRNDKGCFSPLLGVVWVRWILRLWLGPVGESVELLTWVGSMCRSRNCGVRAGYLLSLDRSVFSTCMKEEKKGEENIPFPTGGRAFIECPVLNSFICSIVQSTDIYQVPVLYMTLFQACGINQWTKQTKILALWALILGRERMGIDRHNK